MLRALVDHSAQRTPVKSSEGEAFGAERLNALARLGAVLGLAECIDQNLAHALETRILLHRDFEGGV